MKEAISATQTDSLTWLDLIEQATLALLSAEHFRHNLTNVIQRFTLAIQAEHALLMEINSVPTEPEHLHFQRLLKLPDSGKLIECQLPKALVRTSIKNIDFERWLESLYAASQSSAALATYESSTKGFSTTEKDLLGLNYSRLSKAFVKIVDVPLANFYIFPLKAGEKTWGLLFFTHSKGISLSKAAYAGISTLSNLLANGLMQQHYNVRRKVKEDFSGRSQAQLHSPLELHQQVDPLADQLLAPLVTNTIPFSIFLVDIQKGKAIFSNVESFLGYLVKGDDVVNLFLEIMHPEDLSVGALDFIYELKAAKDGEVVSSEYRMQHKDGHWVWIRERAKIFKRFDDGVVHQYISILEDTTEKHKTDENLAEQKALLQATLNTLPDVKLRMDNKGRIFSIYASEAEKLQMGIDVEACEKQGITAFLPVYVAQGITNNAVKAQATGELQTFEFFQAKGGVRNYYESRIAAVDKTEVIVVLRNITMLKQTQTDLHEQNNKLDQKNRQLQKYIESNLQLENFAYIASHDLREPLRTIRTFAQYLEKNIAKDISEESQSHLQFIITAANRMNHLIEDLLLYSAVDANPSSNESIMLPALIKSVQEELQVKIKETKAQITTVDIPNTIYGSPSRIQQVFQNLLSNAIKFRKEGVAPVITIQGKETPTHWKFSISDNGIGIKAEFFEQIFIIFKKLHGFGTYQGTGIGLALVKLIVTQHDGEIWLESVENQGTTFHFTILK